MAIKALHNCAPLNADLISYSLPQSTLAILIWLLFLEQSCPVELSMMDLFYTGAVQYGGYLVLELW